MTQRLTATQASRQLSDLLNRVRYQQESFIVTRGDEPIAEIRPVMSERAMPDLRALVRLLERSRMPDEGFAADLEAVQASQSAPPEDPWGS